MDCRQCRDKIFAYLEGEMNKTERTGFEEHVASCPACSEELEKEKKITAGLSSINENVPEDFLQGVRAKIETESHAGNKFFSLSYLLRVFVPVAAVLIIALIITRNQPTSRDESEEAPGGIGLKRKSDHKEYFSAYQEEPLAEIMEEKELLQAGEREADDAISMGVADDESRSLAKAIKPATPPAKSEELLFAKDLNKEKTIAVDNFAAIKDPITQILLLSNNPQADILKVEAIAKNQRAAVHRKIVEDKPRLDKSARIDDITIDINVSYSNYSALILELEQINDNRKKKLRSRSASRPLAMDSAVGRGDIQQKQNIIINIFQIDNNKPDLEEPTKQQEPSETP